MSALPAASLPPELLERFQGAAHAWRDQAFFLTTTDRRGWPHAALLSYDEAWAPDASRLRVALYADSRTADNLRLRGVTTLLLVGAGCVHYIKGVARELEGALPEHPGWAVFEASLEEVRADAARADWEGAARLTGSLSLERDEPGAELRRALERT